jgi:putative ABC transport system substrate-binding protein
MSAAALWPLVVRAQPAKPRVGVVLGYIQSDSEARRRVDAFRRALQQRGWVDGDNVTIEYRFGEGDTQRTEEQLKEIAATQPDVMLVAGSSAVLRPKRAGVKLPVVFVQADDPLGSGIIDNLARPGGNFTGFAIYDFSYAGKQLEILKEIAPCVSQVVVIHNPATGSPNLGTLRVIENQARTLGVQVSGVGVRNGADVERAMEEIPVRANVGIIVMNYFVANVHRKFIIEASARHRIPTIFPYRHYVIDGGLVSYGTDAVDQFINAATYIDRILRGHNPGDLPVRQPNKFELVINLRTAKAMGLTVPQRLLAFADEVIK